MSEITTISKQELLSLIDKPNPTILDIGAFDGADSYEFAELGCEVHAFEPLPYNLAMMRKHDNIMVYPYAIGAGDYDIDFHMADNHCSGSTRAPKTHLKIWPKVTFPQTRSVPCIKLDTWFKDNPGEIDLIWADVNGSEADLILGATETLKHTQFIFIEASDKELYEGQISVQELIDCLPDFELLGVYNDYERFCDLLFKRK